MQHMGSSCDIIRTETCTAGFTPFLKRISWYTELQQLLMLLWEHAGEREAGCSLDRTHSINSQSAPAPTHGFLSLMFLGGGRMSSPLSFMLGDATVQLLSLQLMGTL